MRHRNIANFTILTLLCIQTILVSCAPALPARITPMVNPPTTAPVPTQTNTPVVQPTATLLPPTLTATLTSTSQPIVIPTQGTPAVMKAGPHLAFLGSNDADELSSLWITDASYLQLDLLADHIFITQNLPEMISPDRSKIAVFEVRDSIVTLNIVSSITGETTRVAEVLSYTGNHKLSGYGTTDGLIYYLNATWTPDSQMLAFISIDEATQSTLSTYSLSTGQITKYSAYTGSAVFPSFAPDGNRILFFSVDEIFPGADTEIAGMWRLKVGSGDISRLEEFSNGTSCVLVGWLDNRRAVIRGGSDENYNLRIVDLVTKEQQYLTQSQFYDAAVTSNGGVFFSSANGVIYATVDDTRKKTIAEGNFISVFGDPERNFFFLRDDNGTILVVDKSGEIITSLPFEGYSATVYGNIYTINQNDGDPLIIRWMDDSDKQVAITNAGVPIWDEAGNLIFTSGDSILRADAPDFSQVTPIIKMPASWGDIFWMK